MKMMNLCLGLIVGLLLCAADPARAAVLYANDFSTVGAKPSVDGWTFDSVTVDSYGTYAAWPPVPGNNAMRAFGAWSHALTQNSAADSTITIAMTLENEGANSGDSGGFGLSSTAANSGSVFTANGPRMMWTAPWTGIGNIGTLTFTGPIAGGSVTASATVPSNVNEYWRGANVVMEVNTMTGLAQGYYNDGTLHQVISNFDMKGSLTAAQFNALFANGGMANFGGKFAGSAAFSWIDNINITSTAIPEPASLGLLALGVLALARRRR